jgi:RNA polymerase sigma-54 factor
MRFDTGLHQRLEQRMILAPRMIQAMEILQLPLQALQERIEQELIANPVLEIRSGEEGEPAPSAEAEGGEPEAAPDSPVAETEHDLVVRADNSPEGFERLSNLVDRWENYFETEGEGGGGRRRPRGDQDGDAKSEAMQNTADAGQTLQEYMLAQWHVEDATPRILALGDLLIRNLDDNGYVRVPLEELANEAEPPAAPAEMEEALAGVQRAGPPGVGARSLEECLLLQLRADPERGGPLPEDSIEVRIIRHHLRDLSANRYPLVAKAVGASIEEVKQAVERIRRLNPKPGSAISPRRTPPIVPDVRIEWDDEAGQYRVAIERGGAPELYISRAYRKLVKRRDLDDETRRFVASNIRSARWLMDAIEQRRDTLRRVVESILKFQRPFFDEGPDHLRPLKMQEVADDVHLHVGTISRSVADKYADTPWGIFALRDYFTGGTQTAAGEEVSWDRVRVRLKALIAAEDKAGPLSDEQLVEMLKAEGIDLARRTVAKYREELGIPSSRRRRQY